MTHFTPPAPAPLPSPNAPSFGSFNPSAHGFPAAVALQGETQAEPGAPGQAEAPPGFFNSLWFPILMMFAIFWLIVIGPERKQRKKREAMLSALEKGQRVLTSSGIYGQVVQVQDQVVSVQVAEGVRMRFARHAIQAVLEGDGDGAKGEAQKAEPAKAAK